MRIDLHTHSAVSDGTDTPTGLVASAIEAGLDVMALTDHDTFDGVSEAKRAASGTGLRVVAGVEMSTQRRRRSVHLLGYGCDPADAQLLAELGFIRAGRTARVPQMLSKLAGLGMPLDLHEVRSAAGSAPSVGRPHIADAMVARGYVGGRDEAFERWLYDGGPAYVDRYSTRLEDAIELLHDAGGAAVLAHPWSRGGRAVLPEHYLAQLVRRHGLDGLEADHPDHDEATSAQLRALAGRLGVLATGSSDHHGTGKTRNPLGARTTSEEAFDALLSLIAQRGGRA